MYAVGTSASNFEIPSTSGTIGPDPLRTKEDRGFLLPFLSLLSVLHVLHTSSTIPRSFCLPLPMSFCPDLHLCDSVTTINLPLTPDVLDP